MARLLRLSGRGRIVLPLGFTITALAIGEELVRPRAMRTPAFARSRS